MAVKGLGAGLGALFGDEALFDGHDGILNLPISKVEPRVGQPRISFDETALNELAESLQQYGLIQPLTVRKLDSGYYQIIAGERRWRAARMAGFNEVPVRVIEADDRRVTELALVENLQREDLNPIEEARGYKTLMEEYGLTQDQTAQSVGKSRPTVANALRLLALCPEVLDCVEKGSLSGGHARALVPLKDPAVQVSVARKIISEGLSVRQTEKLAASTMKRLEIRDVPKAEPAGVQVNYIADVERRLGQTLGRKVKIEYNKRKGKIELEYYGRDDMEMLIEALFSLKKAGGAAD